MTRYTSGTQFPLVPTTQKGLGVPMSSPNDTRYPFPAVLSGIVAGAAIAGGVLLTPLAALGWVAPVVGGLVGTLVGSSIKFADQWEKAVVLRLGKYRGLRGPGPFIIIPVQPSCWPLKRRYGTPSVSTISLN